MKKLAHVETFLTEFFARDDVEKSDLTVALQNLLTHVQSQMDNSAKSGKGNGSPLPPVVSTTTNATAATAKGEVPGKAQSLTLPTKIMLIKLGYGTQTPQNTFHITPQKLAQVRPPVLLVQNCRGGKTQHCERQTMPSCVCDFRFVRLCIFCPSMLVVLHITLHCIAYMT